MPHTRPALWRKRQNARRNREWEQSSGDEGCWGGNEARGEAQTKRSQGASRRFKNISANQYALQLVRDRLRKRHASSTLNTDASIGCKIVAVTRHPHRPRYHRAPRTTASLLSPSLVPCRLRTMPAVTSDSPAAAAYSPSLEYLSTGSVGGGYLRSSSFSIASADPFAATLSVSDDSTHHTTMSRTRPTPGIPLGSTALCEVLDVYGAPVSIARLAASSRTHCVLVFVPRDRVELAALVYAKVAHLLQQAGAKLVFVSAWLPAQARKFLTRFERVSPFPGALVCDPDATLFRRFHLTRSRLGAIATATAPRALRNALKNVTYRAQNRDIASTRTPSARLRCGAVVLRLPTAIEMCELSESSFGSIVSPNIVYQSAETTSNGTACHLDVVVCCGVHGAFVPDIDPSHLYRRFNNMRITGMKARQADLKEERIQRERTTKLVTQSRQRTSRQRTSRQRTWHG